jgi:hypothetical protein
MKIRPVKWTFTGDYCCQTFKNHTQKVDDEDPDIILSGGGLTIYFRGIEIDNCPFCGKKITLERMVS